MVRAHTRWVTSALWIRPNHSLTSVSLLTCSTLTIQECMWFAQIESPPLSTTVREMNPHWDVNTITVSGTSDTHLTLPICKTQTISCLNYWASPLLSPLPEGVSSSDSPSSSFIPFFLGEPECSGIVPYTGFVRALESWRMTELCVWGKALCWDMIVRLLVGPAPPNAILLEPQSSYVGHRDKPQLQEK